MDCRQVNLKKKASQLPQVFLGVGKCDLNVQARISDSFAAVILSVKKLLLLPVSFPYRHFQFPGITIIILTHGHIILSQD